MFCRKIYRQRSKVISAIFFYLALLLLLITVPPVSIHYLLRICELQHGRLA